MGSKLNAQCLFLRVEIEVKLNGNIGSEIGKKIIKESISRRKRPQNLKGTQSLMFLAESDAGSQKVLSINHFLKKIIDEFAFRHFRG